MKKRTLLLGLALVAVLSDLTAQKQFPLRVTTDSLRFRVVQQAGRLGLERLAASNPTGRNMILEILLDDADLLVVCTADARQAEKGTLSAQFALQLRPEGRKSVLPRAADILEKDELPARHRQIRWLDLAETTLELGQDYTLIVQKSTLGLVDCNAPRPVFTLKKQLPYFAVAGVGLAATGIGQLYNNRKKSDYQAYLRLWSEGNQAADAQPFFDAAKKHERTARLLTIGGLAILAVDAALWGGHLLKIRRKQKIYDRFCAENTNPAGPSKSTSMIRISPFTDMAQPGGCIPAAGLNIVFSF